MKKTLIGSTLAAALLISTSLALALDATVKIPDVKGAAKASVEGSKAGAKTAVDSTKAGAKATLDSGKAAAANAKSAVKSRIIDINSASEAELKAVPGIGDTYASKIIAGRPYTNKTQLKSRNIMPAPVYDKVKDLVVAKQAAKKAVTVK
jgi:DNA uptake protein ComE-like DNA-binding protein